MDRRQDFVSKEIRDGVGIVLVNMFPCQSPLQHLWLLPVCRRSNPIKGTDCYIASYQLRGACFRRLDHERLVCLSEILASTGSCTCKVFPFVLNLVYSRARCEMQIC
jgi:hypothetical protein